jgi:MFS family permease
VGYIALLRQPGAARLLASSLIGRIPIIMVPLGAILLLRAHGSTFAVAGAVAAAYAVGAGMAAIPQGRLIDRLGQTRVLLALASAYAVAIVALVVAARARAGPWALVGLGTLGGLTIPPLGAAMRALWPELVGTDELQAAYALDAVAQEAFYISGPLLVGAIVALASPDLSVAASAVLAVGGTAWFAAAALSRAQRGGRSSAGRLGALAAPGLRTLVLVLLPVGVAFGAIELTVPALTEEHGSRAAAGLVIAMWGVGSMIGGLWYGRHRSAAPPERRLALVLAALPPALATLALAGSIAQAAVLAVVAGMPIAPAFGAAYALVDRLAPAGTVTEAFTLTTTAIVVGAAIGNAAAGALVAPIGTTWTFVAAAAVAALAPLAALARRATLVPAAA